MENLPEDNEEEEEEIIVSANFEVGTVDKEIFQQPNLKFKIIGLDSDNPVVQLGDTTFKGVWTDTIGTKVFFEEDPSPEQMDPVFTIIPPKMLKYKCMTTKSIEFSRIFLKSKNSEGKDKDNTIQLTGSNDNSVKGEQESIDLTKNITSCDIINDAIKTEINIEHTMQLAEDFNESESY